MIYRYVICPCFFLGCGPQDAMVGVKGTRWISWTGANAALKAAYVRVGSCSAANTPWSVVTNMAVEMIGFRRMAGWPRTFQKFFTKVLCFGIFFKNVPIQLSYHSYYWRFRDPKQPPGMFFLPCKCYQPQVVHRISSIAEFGARLLQCCSLWCCMVKWCSQTGGESIEKVTWRTWRTSFKKRYLSASNPV